MPGTRRSGALASPRPARSERFFEGCKFRYNDPSLRMRPMTSTLAAPARHLDAYSWVGPLVVEFARERDVYAIGRLQSLRRLGISLKNGRTDGLSEIAFEGFGVQMFTRDGASAIGSIDAV